jgi:hypothetical protein
MRMMYDRKANSSKKIREPLTPLQLPIKDWFKKPVDTISSVFKKIG